jgi:hypothetical protein
MRVSYEWGFVDDPSLNSDWRDLSKQAEDLSSRIDKILEEHWAKEPWQEATQQLTRRLAGTESGIDARAEQAAVIAYAVCDRFWKMHWRKDQSR